MLTLTKPRLSLEKRTKDCPIDKVTMRVTISIVADAIRLIDGRSVPFDPDGWLPEGIYPTTIEEIDRVFGTTMGRESRPDLMGKLMNFIKEVAEVSWIKAIIVNGGFVSLRPDPNDIDILIVLDDNYVNSSSPSAMEENILDKRYLMRHYSIHLYQAVFDGWPDYDFYTGFFLQRREYQYVNGRKTKGILRLSLQRSEN